MAYVPGYDYDVFVSYAHADNIAVDSEDHPWVGRFVELLTRQLTSSLRGAAPRIYFDHRSLHAGQEVGALRDAARRSALFLAFSSPAYVDREWTLEELRAFAGSLAATDTTRLFTIELMPLQEDQAFPPELASRVRARFSIAASPHSDNFRPMSPEWDAREFYAKLQDVAGPMARKLRDMQREGAPDLHVAAPTPSPNPAARKILLAQVTDDLEDERDQLRRYLEQFHAPVLADPYPQGSEEFLKAFARDCQGAEILVQLLGPRPGRKPPGLEEGYTCAQARLAKAAGLEIVHWRRPDLDPNHPADPAYETLLRGGDVIVSSFEAFKGHVRERVFRPAASTRASKSSMIFIDADEDDIPIARQFGEELKRHAITSVLPSRGGEASSNRDDIDEKLIDCDAILVIYGNAPSTWIDRQIRRYAKLKHRRTEKARFVALYKGPPTPKGEIRIFEPDLQEIESASGWTIEPLHSLIAELRKE